MSPARALELISAVANGVGAAHRQNIVHRDLKPLNIMLQDGVPVAEGLKILDFGLAKIKSGDLLGSFIQAKTSGLMGSPFYMAPEQWSDDEPDARADIYSLGVILFQMLGGEVPFKGSSIPSIMKKHLTVPPPTFQSLGVTVPAGIEAVVRHSLEKEVDARIDSVETFLKELRGALNSSPVSVRTPRETDGLDPNKTMVSELSSTSPQTPVEDSDLTTSFDSMAGTVSSSALDEQVQQQLSNTAAAHRREQEEREQVAREELARETEARRQAQEEEERKRVLPVIRDLKRRRPDAIISVDTYKASVARAAVEAGAEIVNDISGFRWDPKMAKTVAELKVGAVLMHTRGRPDEWRSLPPIGDPVLVVKRDLRQWAEAATLAGIKRDHLAVDPGFGFGKRFEENYPLLARFADLQQIGYPLVAGMSRKSFIGRMLASDGRDAPIERRLYGTVATEVTVILKGAHVIRTHDVRSSLEAAKVADAIVASGG